MGLPISSPTLGSRSPFESHQVRKESIPLLPLQGFPVGMVMFPNRWLIVSRRGSRTSWTKHILRLQSVADGLPLILETDMLPGMASFKGGGFMVSQFVAASRRGRM